MDTSPTVDTSRVEITTASSKLVMARAAATWSAGDEEAATWCAGAEEASVLI